MPLHILTKAYPLGEQEDSQLLKKNPNKAHWYVMNNCDESS